MSTNDTKRNTAIEATIEGFDANAPKLTLDFANGKTLAIEPKQLSADILAQAIMHGLKQKLVDAAAISRDPVTGATATIDTKYAAVREVYDRLLAGEWNKRREGGGGGSGEGGLLFRALVKFYEGKKDSETVRVWLEGKSKAEQAALRANPKIAAIIETLRPKADEAKGEDLLNELDGL